LIRDPRNHFAKLLGAGRDLTQNAKALLDEAPDLAAEIDGGETGVRYFATVRAIWPTSRRRARGSIPAHGWPRRPDRETSSTREMIPTRDSSRHVRVRRRPDTATIRFSCSGSALRGIRRPPVRPACGHVRPRARARAPRLTVYAGERSVVTAATTVSTP
jgi:hypothetical protein